MTTRLMALLLPLTVLLGGGCSALMKPCAVTISEVPPGATLAAGDLLPGGLPVIAAPGDIDSSATTILADVNGPTTVNLKLLGDAIARLGAHTAGHEGEPMAIAVNGRVVAVPIIRGAIQGGEIQITSGSTDAVDVGEAFAGCAR